MDVYAQTLGARFLIFSFFAEKKRKMCQNLKTSYFRYLLSDHVQISAMMVNICVSFDFRCVFFKMAVGKAKIDDFEKLLLGFSV